MKKKNNVKSKNYSIALVLFSLVQNWKKSFNSQLVLLALSIYLVICWIQAWKCETLAKTTGYPMPHLNEIEYRKSIIFLWKLKRETINCIIWHFNTNASAKFLTPINVLFQTRGIPEPPCKWKPRYFFIKKLKYMKINIYCRFI